MAFIQKTTSSLLHHYVKIAWAFYYFYCLKLLFFIVLCFLCFPVGTYVTFLPVLIGREFLILSSTSSNFRR